MRNLSLAAVSFLLSAGLACSTPLPGPKSETVDAKPELERLLREQDTDHDSKITVLDHGTRKFELHTVDGESVFVQGVPALSALDQDLILATERKQYVLIGDLHFREAPADRVGRRIRENYWDALTRILNESGLPQALVDEKVPTIDGQHYIYVPESDARSLSFYGEIAKRKPELKLNVKTVPKKLTSKWLRGLEGHHGLVAIAPDRPFVVPGGRFNELYGWDSYFISLGLIHDGKRDLARSIADHLIYEIENYGMILNANRSYYLGRSQPPLLTALLRSINENTPPADRIAQREWLARGLRAAAREYDDVWMSEPRFHPESGLSRYAGIDLGPCPEVEPGHYDLEVAKYAKQRGQTDADFLRDYRLGKIHIPALDVFFRNDRAVRESGHDTTYRFDLRAGDFLTVDLNSLLYRYENDIADILDREFGGKLDDSMTSKKWRARAKRRVAQMQHYFWDEKQSGFFDYDLKHHRRSTYVSATGLYPLWAGWARPEQAQRVAEKIVPQLEGSAGLASTSLKSRGPITEGRKQRQWDFPYGWPPHQIFAWRGLIRYGFSGIARRLAQHWTQAIAKNAGDYQGVIPEKMDIMTGSHEVFAEYGNVGTQFDRVPREGFGWTNSSYQLGRDVAQGVWLNQPTAPSLEELPPPKLGTDSAPRPADASSHAQLSK